VFARRQALGLAYHSQRSLPEDRAIERSMKAREKLGVTDCNMLDMPYCPSRSGCDGGRMRGWWG
jgi:hypothetical protein